MYRGFGVALAIFALATAVVPHYTDCYSQGSVLTLANGKTQPMKCHWTAQAEIAVGVPLIGVGVMLSLGRRKGMVRSLSVIGIALGAMALALPYGLIGTCAMPTHFYNTAMKPALTALGSITIVGSLGALLLTRRLNG